MPTTTGSGPSPQVPTPHDDVIDDSRRRLFILAAMCVALVAVVASVSGLNVAQQALAADLDASQSAAQLSLSLCMIGLGLGQMLAGPMRDQIGRRVPLLVGVGVSSPQQAVEVCEVADGAVVGSAFMRKILDGASPDQVADQVGEFRDALDRGM